MNKIRVAVLGASGYTAVELIEILLRHPQASVVAATSRQDETKTLADHHPRLRGRITLQCQGFSVGSLVDQNIETVFSCLPHGASASAVAQVLEAGMRVIDLSADYRLKSHQDQELWYGEPHHDAVNLKHAVYGLPELESHHLAGARLVANPGCYPQSVILAMAPLIAHGMIEPQSIVADCKSGVSGAGRTPKLTTLFPECNESVSAYQVGNHRHTPEMEQALNGLSDSQCRILFIPHLVPMDRGILATVVATPYEVPTNEKLYELFASYYSSKPFVRIVPTLPGTKQTSHTNFVDIHPIVARGRIVVVACLDNLIRGASGVAVQNFNLMHGLEETLGLLP